MNYYDVQSHVSNSDLKALRLEIFGSSLDYSHLQPIFDFGNLVDYLITETERVNFDDRMIEGVKKPFTVQDFEKALRMRDAYLNDSFCRRLAEDKNSKPQKEFYRTLDLNWNGFDFKFPARCKTDIYNPVVTVDVKTTGATSKSGFEYSFDFFDYDQQGASYKKLSKSSEFMFVGISKNFKKFEKPKIFKLYLSKELEERGMKKYKTLAFNYKLMML